jgi:DegV family protein with EDD domain
MPANVAVVTDSTACLPEQLAMRWDISVVQVQLHVGDRLEEERRFDRARLVDELRSGGRVATSPPDPGAFFRTYQQAATSGASEVVSVHVSGRMSATVRAARDAARRVRIPVHVLDSGTTGMSLGFAALSAARAAGAGAQARRVIHAAETRYRTSTELIYVDTLKYLRRGGRIGAATAMLGSMLSIRPVLTVVDGEVAPVAKAAGSRRALAKMVSSARTRTASRISPSSSARGCRR